MFAVNYFWVGGDGVWSDSSHWSLTQGGTGGDGVPGVLDNAIFCGTNIVTVDGEYEVQFLYMSSEDGSASYGASSLTLTGSGTVLTHGFDFPNSDNHTASIDTNCTLKITGNFFGNSDFGTMEFSGTGTLFVPASGANLDYGSNKISYDSSLKIEPYGSPSDYTVTVSNLENLSDDDSSTTAVITLSRGTSGTADVDFNYEVVNLVNSSGTGAGFFLDSTQLTSGLTGTLTVGNVGSGSQSFYLAEQGTIGNGDGFSIKIKTPDNLFTLCVITWYKGFTIWTGNVSSDWSDVNNWILSDNTKTLVQNLADSNVEIDLSCVHFPVISSSICTVKSLTIAPDAKLTITGGEITSPSISVGSIGNAGEIIQSGGKLSVCNFQIIGNSRYTATGGELNFIQNTITSDNPVLTVGSAANFTVNDVVVKSGIFTVPFDMNVNGNFTNESNVICDYILTLYKDFEDEGTFTGISGTGVIKFSGTENQNFSANTGTAYNSIEINKPSGDFVFADDTVVLSDVTVQSNGSVKIPAGKTLTVCQTSPFVYKNYTHSSGTTGTTLIEGTLKAAVITLGNVTVSGTGGSIQGTSVSTGNITASSSSDEIELKASSGSFSTGSIGSSSTGFSKVTLDSGNTDLVYSGTEGGAGAGISVYSDILELKSLGNVAVEGVSASGELIIDTDKEIYLGSLAAGGNGSSVVSANKITFSVVPGNDFKLFLNGTIKVLGTDGFVVPLYNSVGIPVVLNGNTVIDTSVSAGGAGSGTGPVTLWDNITGYSSDLFDLTVKNGGTFTFNDCTTAADPAALSSTPSTYAQVNKFIQSGTGSVILKGDVYASSEISFNSSVSLTDYFYGKTDSSGSVTFNSSVIDSSANYFVVIDSPQLKFTGGDAQVKLRSLKVNNGGIIINKTANTNTQAFDTLVETGTALTVQTGTVAFNDSVTVGSDFTNANGATVENHKNLSVKGNFTDEGTFNEDTDSKIILNGAGTAAQNFKAGTANYKKIEIDKDADGVVNIDSSVELHAADVNIIKNGTANFNGSVNISSFSDSSDSGDIKFLNGGVIASDHTFVTPKNVIFGDDVSDSFKFGSTGNKNLSHITGPTIINGTLLANNAVFGAVTLDGTVFTKEGQIYNGAVSGAQMTFTAGPFTDSTGSTIPSGSSIGNVSSIQVKDTLTSSGDVKFTGFDITIENTVDAAGQFSFTNYGVLKLQDMAGSTDTAEDINCSSFIQNDPAFSAGGAGGSGTLTSKVEISSDITTTSGRVLFTSPVILKGDVKIISGEKAVFEENASVNGDGSGTGSGFTLLVQTQDDALFKGMLGDVEEPENLTVTTQKNAVFEKQVKIVQNCTITNTGYFKTGDGVSFSSGNFVQNGTGKNMIGGSFFITGTAGSGAVFGTAANLSDVYAYGSALSPASDFGTAGKNILITNNLIFCGDKTYSINSKVTAKNIVLYKGVLNITDDFEAINDAIFLGSAYSTKDLETGIGGEFAYDVTRESDWSSVNYTSGAGSSNAPWETQLPDSSPVPEGITGNQFAGQVNVAADKKIKVGKNLYANGITLQNKDPQNWILELPDLTDVQKGFAESYNSSLRGCTVVCYEDGSQDGSKARVLAYQSTDSGNNQNIDFEEFKIVNAYTVRDNVIRVEFNRPVRKIYTVSDLKFLPDSSLNVFSSAWLDEDCTVPVEGNVVQNYLSGTESIYYFYLKTDSSWNTDATGKSSGTVKSTDRNGNHKDTIPCLNVPKAVGTETEVTKAFVVTDIWGKRINNYSKDTPVPAIMFGSEDDLINDIEDKTGPVLVSVRTGQENHAAYDRTVGANSQKSYDAHNFIEFCYSEKVNFGSQTAAVCNIWLPYDDIVNSENTKVSSTFGEIEGDIKLEGNLKFAGLCTIQNGKIYTGSNGTENKSVNALYRLDEYSLRYSVAGYTDGTLADPDGNLLKNWKGYIEQAVIPSGTVTMNSSNSGAGGTGGSAGGDNPLVIDIENNHQIMIKPGLSVNSTAENEYGKWDVLEPVFAPLRMNPQVEWGNSEFYEAIGNNMSGGSTLDRIEFHLFDNKPNYDLSDAAVWYSERGWCENNSSDDPQLYKPDSYCADIFGGSRSFDDDVNNRTEGGIRYSSLSGATKAFLYVQETNGNPVISFNNSVQPYAGARGSLFTGKSTVRHSAAKTDGLYFGIPLADLSLPVNSNFTVSYNDTKGFITDLAGNRLRSAKINTVDRSTPSFNITLSPVNRKELLVIFVKKINQKTVKLIDNNGYEIPVTETFLDLLPQCFEIIKIDSNGIAEVCEDLKIAQNVQAKKINLKDEQHFTGFVIQLNRELTLSDIKEKYIRVKNPQKYDVPMSDPITQIPNSKVTLIQDEYGNFIGINSTHVISDFAINTVNPMYAYNTDMVYGSQIIMDGVYEEGSWGVHDWNKDQQNYGTLFADESITVSAKVDDESVEKNQFDGKLRMFLSNNPDAESISSKMNGEIGMDFRIWLPAVDNQILSAVSLLNNKNYFYEDSVFVTENNLNDGLKFDIPKNKVEEWKSGDQVSFLFGYLNDDGTLFRRYTSPVYDLATDRYDFSASSQFPLYAVRTLTNDILSLDLWSFRLKSLIQQRGGVTIMNNVINALKGEKVVVKVQMPQDAKVNILVMTLDGNIVTYLNRDTLSAGDHYFSWNGKNQNGLPVARGLYFVRVSGSNFDETRKVMVVK